MIARTREERKLGQAPVTYLTLRLLLVIPRVNESVHETDLLL